MARTRAFSMRVAAVMALMCAGANVAAAQPARNTTLTVNSTGLSVTTTTPDDYDAGSVVVGTVTFTVDLVSATGNPLRTRVTTVNLLCAAGCPAGFGRLEWRRADLGVWNPLTTSPVLVEQRTATFDGANDPWSRQVFWRYTLDWTTVPPSGPTAFPVTFQLVVTAP